MKKINYIRIAMALSLIFFFSQCHYDQILFELPQPPTNEEISFQNDVIPIFDASCNSSGCHNTGGIRPNLEPSGAYDALINGGYIDTLVPENSELYQWMAGRRSLPMPLTGSDATYNTTVLQWIRQGANNN